MDNLIQQLQQTPKWKEFEEWYEKQDFYIQMKYTYKDYWFEVLDFPFQKEVFEKFIESHGFNIEKQLHNIPYHDRLVMAEEEQLKIRYKEAWFIRTVVIVDYYTPVCLNPIDHYLRQTKPFESFEELLIWYFNN